MSPRAWLPVAMVCAGWAGGVGAVVLDPGGVSVSFTGCGSAAVTGPDLLRNGGMEHLDAAGKPADWQPDSYVWLAVTDPARQAQVERRVKPLLQWDVGPDHAAQLTIPQPAYDPADPPGHEICAMFHQRVVLPPLTSATRYLLSYHHRGWCGQDMPNCRAYTRITFYDSDDPAQAKPTRVYDQVLFQPGAEWRPGQLITTAPADTRVLDVRIALTGVGEVQYDDVALHAAQEQDNGLSARLMPEAMLDNRYCLSSGDLLTMIFGFRNGDDRTLEQPQLVLRMPAWVEVLETAPAVHVQRQTAEGMAEYRYDLTPLKGRIHGTDFPYPWNQWEGLNLFVRTAREAGPELHEATYWMEDGAFRSEPQRFSLQITPALPPTVAPKLFRTGAHPFLIWSATQPETIAGFGRTFAQVGFNAVHCPPSAIGDDLGKRGLERFTQPFANGYTIYGPKPDEAAYRDIEGKAVPDAICPTEVYRRGAHFQSAVAHDLLRRMLVTERRADQLMCNWEPYMHVGRGCYCDRCKEEFRAFSQLADVDATWPRTVAEKHGDLLRQFRRWQHAQFMATIEETVAGLGKEAGREMHFIPELHYVNLTAGWEKLGDSREFAAVDYLDRLPVLNAWGPYNWWVFGRGPYEYVRGLHLNCHVTAQQVHEFLRSRLPADKQPRLYAFPYGTFEGATEPEAIGFELLTYFLNGYAGALVYLYPGGSDARWWRAIGEANAQIAQFEEYVMEGKRSRTHQVQALTPLPLPDPRFLESGCMMPTDTERWRETPLLQSWEFERGGRRLIAVANFWERGECFFRLTADVPAGKYVLREPLSGRCFGTSEGAALTADDLKRGVLLHVGALRCAWFLLEPARPGAVSDELARPQEMQAAMQQRLPAIREAAAQ